MIILVISAAIINCEPEKEKGTSMPDRDINLVMKDHVDDLMAIPGVVGVAIGELDDGTPCIKIFVVEVSDELNRKIPELIEGHPVEIVESGIIRTLSS